MPCPPCPCSPTRGSPDRQPDSALREQVASPFEWAMPPRTASSRRRRCAGQTGKREWQVLFLDRRLPDLDAEELIAIIQRRFPGTQVVMLDSDGSSSTKRGEITARQRSPAG